MSIFPTKSITIVPVDTAPSAQIRGSRQVPGGGADLFVKMSDVIDALKATGHDSAVQYLDDAWMRVNF